MEKEKMAPHVEDIIRALGSKMEKKKIEDELDNYLNVYRVNLDTAKRSIVRKYGGNAATLSVGTNKKLSELAANEQAVDILCRVLTVNPKEIEVEGQRKEIIYGLVSDGTETLPYTAWETQEFKVEKGDVIRATNAYTGVKEWNGKPQLNFGNRTRISREDKNLITLPDRSSAPDRGIPRKCTVKDLQAGMRNIVLSGRILTVEKREVTVSEAKKTVFSGNMGDATGQVQFSAWDDFSIRENDCIWSRAATSPRGGACRSSISTRTPRSRNSPRTSARRRPKYSTLRRFRYRKSPPRAAPPERR